jgi:16S rRNA (adenine1518-N6/adenine1519-N6)-dimethyltransferase
MSDNTHLIEEYKGFAQQKSLGQHFLTNEEVVERMVEAAEITENDTVLEIGPGLGILSKKIVASPAKEVILCEKDERLVLELKRKISNKRTKIINQDALILIPNLQVESPFKVVANLPYNISSPVITSLLTFCPTLPSMMILMLQKEVAERLASKPGQRNRGILSVLVELYGEPKIIDQVSKDQFYPAPKVDSSVLQISNIKSPDLDSKVFLKMLKLSFAGKRKKIKNSLFSSLKIEREVIEKINIDVNERPEDLSLSDWKEIYDKLKTYL